MLLKNPLLIFRSNFPTACYVSDRQISVRIGKAFWSRGPGPMTSNDFPSLQSQNNGIDDYALTFQAHLELTQLFSNAHDILYGTKSHRDQLYSGGQYVKYLVSLLARKPNGKILTECLG